VLSGHALDEIHNLTLQQVGPVWLGCVVCDAAQAPKIKWNIVHCLCDQDSGFPNGVNYLTFGSADYADPKYAKSFRHRALFTGGNVREAVNDGRADYVPVFLSEIPKLIYSGAQRVDVALSNSFGFGGQDIALLTSRFNG